MRTVTAVVDSQLTGAWRHAAIRKAEFHSVIFAGGRINAPNHRFTRFIIGIGITGARKAGIEAFIGIAINTA